DSHDVSATLDGDRQQAQVEERVDVCPEQQAVGHHVGVATTIWVDVGRLEDRLRRRAGDGASRSVCAEKSSPELGLAATNVDLSQGPLARVPTSNDLVHGASVRGDRSLYLIGVARKSLSPRQLASARLSVSESGRSATF